jgi:site-specific DNA recombinase
MDLKKVVAYCRVSTDKLDQENSFENQKSYFENELSQENGYELIDIFADKGLSGTKFSNRKEFNRMLLMAGLDIDIVNGKNIYTANKYKNSKFKYIYVTNTSRFARNIEVISIIRALKDKGVYVVFKDLNKSTENTEDEALLNIIFTLDEQESRDKSSKVSNGYIRSAMRTDRIHTNGSLYGYKFIESENKLEIIEEEAQVVRLIFDLCIKGNGNRVIRNILTEKGILTRKGKPFGISTINNILKNIKYCGISNRLTYSAPKLFGNNNKIIRNKDENIIYKESDRIPKIISKDIFNQAKEIRAKRVDRSKSKGTYYGKSIYSNKIVCDKCGANYISNVDDGRKFFNCCTKKRFGVSKCDNKNISLNKLDKIVDEYIKNFYIYICNKFKDIKTKLDDKINEYNNLILEEDIESQKDDILNAISKLDEDNDKLLDLYLNSILPRDIYEKRQQNIINEKNKLNKDLENLNNGISEYIIIRDELVQIRKEINSQISKSKNVNKEKFINIIEAIHINNDNVKITTSLEVLIEDVINLISE